MVIYVVLARIITVYMHIYNVHLLLQLANGSDTESKDAEVKSESKVRENTQPPADSQTATATLENTASVN